MNPKIFLQILWYVFWEWEGLFILIKCPGRILFGVKSNSVTFPLIVGCPLVPSHEVLHRPRSQTEAPRQYQNLQTRLHPGIIYIYICLFLSMWTYNIIACLEKH